MPTSGLTFVTLEPRPTAVIARTTTWDEFPRLWGELLDEVYRFVRRHEELATGDGTERWQNVMLYKDDTPEVEVGVLAAKRFEAHGRVIASELPGGAVLSFSCSILPNNPGDGLFGGGGFFPPVFFVDGISPSRLFALFPPLRRRSASRERR